MVLMEHVTVSEIAIGSECTIRLLVTRDIVGYRYFRVQLASSEVTTFLLLMQDNVTWEPDYL